MTNIKRRLPAEWETDGAVITAWPHSGTDWSYMLDSVRDCYIAMAKAIADDTHLIVVTPDAAQTKAALSNIPDGRLSLIELSTNDTWTRDYGPIGVIDEDGREVALDFAFNGWGLKFAADRDNMVTSGLRAAGLLTGGYENRLGFVLEGGSLESDGRGTLLTTSRCLLSPNRNGDLNRDEIGTYLCNALGVERILWLDHGYLAGDDTDSHIDTLARMAPGDTILYVKCDDPDDEHYAELSAMERQLGGFTTAAGRPYNLVALPMPDAIYDSDGERLPATYANYLVTPRTVFMPVYAQPAKDKLACDIILTVFPNHKIVPIDCRALICQHGSLHCATMQISRELVNFI